MSYFVSVVSSNGGRVALFPDKGKTQVVVPNVSRSAKLTVTVIGVSAAGRKGPAGRATLAGAKGKK